MLGVGKLGTVHSSYGLGGAHAQPLLHISQIFVGSWSLIESWSLDLDHWIGLLDHSFSIQTRDFTILWRLSLQQQQQILTKSILQFVAIGSCVSSLNSYFHYF